MNYKKICEQCGKLFYYTSSHKSRKPKYCSRKCSYLKNKNIFHGVGIKSRFKINHKPWNKNLTKETSDLVKQLSEKKKSQLHPTMSIWIKSRQEKYWKNEKYLFNIFKGQTFGKDYKPNELDKKVIEAKILLFKIRRSLNVNK